MEKTKGNRILAVDFGTKRIGTAITDENGEIAQPFSVLKREGNKKDIAKLENIVREYNISLVVFGIPYGKEDKLTMMGEKAKAFGELFNSVTGINVDFVDETMTTYLANEVLNTTGVRREKKKGVVDKIAAAIILQDFLNRKKYTK